MAETKRSCDKIIRQLLNLTGEMINLADGGDAERDDVGCGILFGIVRDCAYKIRSLAQFELSAHQGLAQQELASYEPSRPEERD